MKTKPHRTPSAAQTFIQLYRRFLAANCACVEAVNSGTAPLPNPLPARSSRGEGVRLSCPDCAKAFSLSSSGGEGWGEEALSQAPSSRSQPSDFGLRPSAFGFPLCGRPESAGLLSVGAFTMIEIAISLAVIGFALVAIIGILPLGMTAQRDNRQETIVNQDASILMDAVRNGERGLDDLTNYVIGITNYQTFYNGRSSIGQPRILGYTPTVATLNGGIASPPYYQLLTNGYNIIGLLSTPKVQIWPPGGLAYYSNHVVGVFRSLSGPASEKPPQINPTMQEMALTYKVVADVSGYGTNYFAPNWTNFISMSTNDIIIRSNLLRSFQANLRDVRLTFLWPLLPSGKIGDGRQVYRTMAGGSIVNEGTNNQTSYSPFWFLQPRTYF